MAGKLEEYLKRDPRELSQFFPAGFEINGIIKTGGQGVVCRGSINGTDVAIKIYFAGQLLTRIKREVDLLKLIDHPHIVKLFWNGNIDIEGECYQAVITEFINGEELGDLLNRTALSENQIGRIGFDVASAIEAIWSKKVVHRDLKPPNILIRPNGSACVIDLGIARHLDKSTQTAFGYTLGTRGYYSPEQYKGVKQLTCKSDIYALGIIMIQCATGSHPSGYDQDALFLLQLSTNLPSPINSWGFAELVKRMMDDFPHRRPSIKEILGRLSGYK